MSFSGFEYDWVRRIPKHQEHFRLATPDSSSCPDCGANSNTNFSQEFFKHLLVWSASTSCTQCDFTEEATGEGFPPLPIRNWFIRTHGRWALSVHATDAERLKACKILHCDLSSTLDEVKKMKDRIPGIVYSGTHAEMAWLVSRIRQFGFDGSAIRVDDDAKMRRVDVSLIEAHRR
jgi:hypothetical protein